MTGALRFASTMTLSVVIGCDQFNAIGPDTCDTSAQVRPLCYREGTTKGGVYQSSDWRGELLYFAGGSRIDLRHDLGRSPDFVDLWLSFDSNGVDTGIAQAAGNQAEIICINAHHIQVVNKTCSDFWLLVKASIGPESGAGGDGSEADNQCGSESKEETSSHCD